MALTERERQRCSIFLQEFISLQRELSVWTARILPEKVRLRSIRPGIARTFQNIRLFKDMPVLDNVKVGLHNHYKYSVLTGILRLPNILKQKKK